MTLEEFLSLAAMTPWRMATTLWSLWRGLLPTRSPKSYVSDHLWLASCIHAFDVTDRAKPRFIPVKCFCTGVCTTIGYNNMGPGAENVSPRINNVDSGAENVGRTHAPESMMVGQNGYFIASRLPN
jgi:hypothetical protein